MVFIRSVGSCTDSGSDVYRTSDKTLFITVSLDPKAFFALNGQWFGPVAVFWSRLGTYSTLFVRNIRWKKAQQLSEVWRKS
jgi:hypothetical protein